jgi:hypothetical protein
MSIQFNWYEKEGQDLADSLFAYVSYLRKEQGYRQDENYRHMRLYGNLEPFSIRNYGFYRAETSSAAQNRVTLNIVQSMVDTVVSKLSKNKPRPLFLTDGGDWALQRKAEKLSKFIDGQFYATDFYQKRFMALQDSCIFGTGALKVFREGKKIKLERVFIDELNVDERESVYGEVRQLFQIKRIHKETLKAMFPEHSVAIEMASSPEISAWQSNQLDTNAEMLEVVESWKLPSVEGADDGKHAIVLEKLTLFEQPYKRMYFPFLFWRWSVRPVGFWGQGVAEQLTGLQLEINKILRTIQVSMHLVSVPKIFVEASSKVVSSHLNNKIGGIIKYVGTPPVEGKLGTIPPDLFRHLDFLYNKAYEIVGISQLSAMASKPQGLNSGKALREYNDIESERFMSVAQRDEATVINAAKMFIDLGREIYEEFGEYEVKTQGKRGVEKIEWSEVDMSEDQYIMQCYPVSALSKTPAGRLQDIQELMSAGLIGKEDGMKLLDFPDLQQFYNFNNAGIEDIERTIEIFADKGEYMTPEPYQNLQLGITKMQQAYLMYRSSGMPDSRLELFRRWIEDAQSILQNAQQQAMAEQQMAAMPPVAPELAPPTPLPNEAVLPPMDAASAEEAALQEQMLADSMPLE